MLDTLPFPPMISYPDWGPGLSPPRKIGTANARGCVLEHVLAELYIQSYSSYIVYFKDELALFTSIPVI